MFNRDEARENTLQSSREVGEAPNSPARREIEALHRYLQLLQVRFDQPQEVLHHRQKVLDDQNKRLQRIYAGSKKAAEPSSYPTDSEHS